MKTRAKPGFWSGPKDKALFRYLHAAKVATVEQINRDIYRQSKINTAYKRLQLLQKLGLVRSCHHHALGKRKIVSLTERGFKEFVADGTERTIELKSQAPLHDLALVDVKFHLLELNKVSRFCSENELKTWNIYWQSDDFNKFIDVRCDGVADVNLDGGRVLFAVEMEAVQKARERSQEIIAKYYTSLIPAVLFVCGDDAIRSLFLELEAQHLSRAGDRKSGKFFYVLLDDLLQGHGVVFADVFGNKLRLEKKPDSRGFK